MTISKFAAVAALVASVALAPAANAQVSKDDYVGRWQSLEDDSAFKSMQGREYIQFDLVRCGGDMCAISVDSRGRCGAQLFRFAGSSATKLNQNINMTGKWGSGRAASTLKMTYTESGWEMLTIKVGSSFSTQYSNEGEAQCGA